MNKSLIRRIIFISLLGFFGAVLTIAYHHHDNAFLLNSCAICKVKASLSGTFNKDKIASTSSVTLFNLSSVLIFLGLVGILHDRTSIFISSQINGIYPNKAPPPHC